jgi:KDO2-lipid IV(A) lauroyltransferase
VLRAAAPWPVRLQVRTAKRLGRMLVPLRRRQLAIAARNLQVCFPELSAAERSRLLTRHAESLGASFAEMAIGWFAPIDRLRRHIRVEGREHLEKAFSQGKGVILYAAHFTTLEIGVSILEDLPGSFSCMYRPQRNPMLDAMIRRGRSRFAREQIPRDDVRALLRNLALNRAVVYIPDQTYLGRQSALLPFFGEMAVTNIATGKLARLSGAPVLPYFFRRLPDDVSYLVEIGPPLDGFPSRDPLEDTRRLTALLEAYIREAPEQYLWTYRKFKGRPQPMPDVYRTA